MKISKRQFLSKDCIVCGIKNKNGLHAKFYEMEDGSVISLFQFNKFNQSYPNRVHGGMIAAILDETMGRAILVRNPDCYAVTTSLTTKYRKPVVYDKPLKCVGRIVSEDEKRFEASAELYDEEGTLLDSAVGSYYKLNRDRAANTLDYNPHDIQIPFEDKLTEIN